LLFHHLLLFCSILLGISLGLVVTYGAGRSGYHSRTHSRARYPPSAHHSSGSRHFNLLFFSFGN
jgi:hypothetical protein